MLTDRLHVLAEGTDLSDAPLAEPLAVVHEVLAAGLPVRLSALPHRSKSQLSNFPRPLKIQKYAASYFLRSFEKPNTWPSCLFQGCIWKSRVGPSKYSSGANTMA